MSQGSVAAIRQVMAEDGHHTHFRTRFPALINSFTALDWTIPLPPHVRYIGPVNLPIIEERITQAQQQQNASRSEDENVDSVEYFLRHHQQVVVTNRSDEIWIGTAGDSSSRKHVRPNAD